MRHDSQFVERNTWMAEIDKTKVGGIALIGQHTAQKITRFSMVDGVSKIIVYS